MNTALASEAKELADACDRAIQRLGGENLVVRAQSGAEVHTEIDRMMGSLDLWELRPREAELDCELAAATCRVAGRYALPYPIAERLSGAPAQGIDALAVVSKHAARVNLCVPGLRWYVSDGAESVAQVTNVSAPLGSKLGALASDVEHGPWRPGNDLAPLALVLPTWVLLGMLERAFALTRRHLLDRHQFGRSLASFQALQFRMADTAAQLQAFTELAHYAVWSVATEQPGQLGDALACRLAAIETADTVFRTSHQMHGAMGFCDETPVSWLSRYSQPIRRLPWGFSETEARLLRSMETVPFAGLFTGTDNVESNLGQ
jgi:alkylation response protein AidB-like acyl-CoA dehydrogenase